MRGRRIKYARHFLFLFHSPDNQVTQNATRRGFPLLVNLFCPTRPLPSCFEQRRGVCTHYHHPVEDRDIISSQNTLCAYVHFHHHLVSSVHDSEPRAMRSEERRVGKECRS